MTIEYTYQISPAEEDLLRGVVGSMVRSVYARSVGVSDQGVWASVHSLSMVNGEW